MLACKTAALLELKAEMEHYKAENRRLSQEIKMKQKGRRSLDPTQLQTELQQRQACEDLQAKLADAVEQNSVLEEKCSNFEGQLFRLNEEA